MSVAQLGPFDTCPDCGKQRGYFHDIPGQCRGRNGATRPQVGTVTSLDPERATRYARKALTSECENVSAAPEGQRNDTLNRAAFNIAQLVAGGHLAHTDAWEALTSAGRASGLDDTEIHGTLASGFRAGTEEPRVVPEQQAAPEPTVLDHAALAAAVIHTEEADGDISSIVREKFPIIDWHELWATEDDEEDWIIEPVLPARRLVALFSAPKVGKSLLMLEIAVRVSQGETVLGVTPDRARRVLYVDFENDPRGDVRERLKAMGVKPGALDNLCYLSYPTLAKLDTFAGAAELMAIVAEYQCEVVVIDTISRAVAGEENENDTWLSFYRNTGLAMKQAGVACIRLDHTGKDHEKGMRGGSAKYGDVDAVWKLSKVTEDTYRLDCTDHRMKVTEETLVLTRHTVPHLTHKVAPEGRLAAFRAKVDEIIATLDSADAALDVGRETARELLKTAGIKARNDAISAAIKQRKMRLGYGSGEDQE